MEEIKNKDLKRRIIEISYKKKLSHLGSCLTAVDIIEEIWSKKGHDERFVLSSGHAGLALYVVLEKHGGKDAEEIFDYHGVHPDRCSDCGIDCSSGSLGLGLPIAVGMALADRKKNVYCLISDGEAAEGSIWEALRIAEEQELLNLWIYVNMNGYGGYSEINLPILHRRLSQYPVTIQQRITTQSLKPFPFLKGQDAHYHVMTEAEYTQALDILK